MSTRKSKSSMELQDLKNSKLSLDERAAELVKELGVAGNTRSVAKGLQKGDVFKLTSINKVEMAGATTGFQPMTFSTNIGATVGAKHFASVEFDDESAPALGATVEENAKFFIYCYENDLEFRCVSVREGEPRQIPGGKEDEKYVPKTFKIEVL